MSTHSRKTCFKRFARTLAAVCRRPIPLALLAITPLAAPAQTAVTTHSYDIGRTGQNITETVLTPALLTSGGFGKVATLNFDGQVQAQPLYLPSVIIGGVAHPALFVATEHDSVYAVDPVTGATLWRASLIDAAHGAAAGATPDPVSDTGCGDINAYAPAAAEYGVSGTPVIDPASGTLYVVSKSLEGGAVVQRLHALDITNGAEKLGGPKAISASVKGSGTGSVGGVLNFDPKWHHQRTGLLLVNGVVYLGFGAHCDLGPWHGWMIGYDATTLAQKSVFVTTPNGSGSGIWMGGTGIAADNIGGVARLFPVTGNGTYDATVPYGLNTMDYGDDILRLNVAATGALTVGDQFTPYDQASLSAVDNDLGSGGVLIPPDQTGSNPHILIQAGKAGTLYVVNRDAMGGYNTSNKVLQTVTLGQFRQSPTYWNGNVYFWPSQGRLSRFTLSNGVLSSAAVDVSPQSQNAEFGSRVIVSANGATNAIAWSVDYSAAPQVLYAHDATNVARLLWSSATNAARDGAGAQQKFTIPVVADGRVFVAANNVVNVYGALQPDFTLSTGTPQLTLQPGSSATLAVTATPANGFTGSVSLTLSGLPSGVTASVAAGSTSNTFTVTFTAAATAPITTAATVTLTATGGGVTHTFAEPLSVGSIFQSPLFGTGSASSVAFQDAVVAKVPVSALQINAGWWVDHLQASTAKGALPVHGTSTGGAVHNDTLNPGEYLVRMYGQSSSGNVIAQIAFVTSSGRVIGPYGTAQDAGVHTAFDFSVPAGNGILGFFGKSDTSLDAIGVFYGQLAAADFTLSTGAAQLALQPGTSATLAVTATPINGFNGALSLAVSGLPSGVTATVAAGTTPNTFVVTLATAATAPATSSASATLTVTGGGITHTFAEPLSVGSIFQSPLFGTGSASSVAFQDAVVAKVPVSALQINAGWWVDHLQASTAKGALPVHGTSTGGAVHNDTLNPGEYLVRMYGQSSSGNVIAQIAFVTSSGRVIGPYGTAQDAGVHTAFDFSVPAGNQILGFFGKSDVSLDAIGVFYGPL